MNNMKFGNINTSKKVFIVVEIGNNHEGDFMLQELLHKAAESGVDAVKFQIFLPEHISGGDADRLKKLQVLNFHISNFQIAAISNSKGVIFFSTPLIQKVHLF